MAVLALMSAATTGNNLLYLLESALLSSLLLSALWGRLNLKGLAARAEFPERVFRGAEFPLRIFLENRRPWSAFWIEAASLSFRGRRPRVERISPRAQASLELRYSLPHRGLNLADDLVLESRFPLGFILHSRRLPGIVGNALPRPSEVHSPAEIKAQAQASGKPVLRKGSGEELYGIRDYDPSDSSRLINWKLTAKTGRALVNEYCALQDSRVSVRVGGGEGEAAERSIEEAAGACRFYIDSGAEVRLVTLEGAVDYGKGLLQLDRILALLSQLGPGKTPRPVLSSAQTRAGLRLSILLEPFRPAAPPAPADWPALRGLTFLGSALVLAGMFLIGEISPWILAACAPVVPLGYRLSQRGGPRLPAWLWTLLSLGVLFYVLFVGWRVQGVIVANAYLLIYLIANRALSEVKREELGQVFLILLLGFFLVSGLTISLWYFLLFLLYLAFAAAWLMLAAGADPGGWRGWSWAWAGLVSCGLGLSGILFALAPRFEGLRRINPILAVGLDKLQIKTSAVTGFTENVSLGFFGELKRSSSRAMRVRPPFPPGGRPGALRIRGAAFDVFDGRRWSRPKEDFRYRLRRQVRTSTFGRGWAQARGEQMFFPSRPPARPQPPYEFVIYPMGVSVLFSVGTPWLVEGLPSTPSFDHTDSVSLPAPYVAGISYRLYPAEGLAGFASLEGSSRALERLLQAPESPRVRDLALRLTAGARDDSQKVRAIEGYLRRGYGYSTFSDSRNRSLEDFLFSHKRGNCEYFATAGAVLLRHAGVPARLVTGFLAEDWNEYGKFYDVRQRNAHAWVEAYLPGKGWVTVDPTPPAGAFSASADLLTRRLERLFNAVQAEWYRRVIGYDQSVQRNTFRRLGLALTPELLLLWGRQAFWIALLLALAGGAGLALRRLSGLLRASPAGSYPRAQAALARAGLARQAHLTPREYAQWVMSRRPDLGALAFLAELHYLEAYSPRGLSREEGVESRRLYQEIRSRL